MTPREEEGLSKKQNGQAERNKGAVSNILGNSVPWWDLCVGRTLVPRGTEYSGL